jgi:hypothetical protein
MERGDPMPPCDGRLIRAHLIPKQTLRCAGLTVRGQWSEVYWVWACGGVMGQAGHHGMFDSARTLRVSREALPTSTVIAARILGLEWWIERTYLPQTDLRELRAGT